MTSQNPGRKAATFECKDNICTMNPNEEKKNITMD